MAIGNIDESPQLRRALLQLAREGVWSYEILQGIAVALSRRGVSRLEIMAHFWSVMQTMDPALDEEQLDICGDFCFDLLGRGPAEHIVRLHGDPTDLDELSRSVQDVSKAWNPPLRVP